MLEKKELLKKFKAFKFFLTMIWRFLKIFGYILLVVFNFVRIFKINNQNFNKFELNYDLFHFAGFFW